MLCRAVFAVLAISYLICVLWLSGLQKEDLDVNMLRKLQRHNVNIDDKNRDNLRNDCLNTYAKDDNVNEGSNITKDEDDQKASTLVLESETESNRKYDDESELNNRSSSKDGKQKNIERDTSVNRENIELMAPHENESESDYLKENTGTFTMTKSFDRRMEVNGEQNLDKILNFWNMLNVQKSKESIISVTKRTVDNKRVPRKKITKKSHKADLLDHEPEERSSKEMELINKLLADYFHKKKKSSTTQTTIISSVDLNNLSKLTQQFENFFKLMARNKILVTDNQEDKNDVPNNLPKNRNTVTDNKDFLDNDMPPQTFLMQATNKKFIERNANKHSVSDISHLLFYNDQLKKSFAQANESYLPPYLVPVNNQPNYNLQLYGVSVATTNLPTTVENKIVQPQEIAADKALSKDLIGMIAENVKAIVLKDLHREITSTAIAPSSSTPTTTETSTSITSTITTTSPVAVTTPLENKTIEATQVLRSIMDLFNEFKALKDKTASTVIVTQQPTPQYEIINDDSNNPLVIQNKLLKQMLKQKQSDMRLTKETVTVSYKPYQQKQISVAMKPARMERIDANQNLQFPVQVMKYPGIIQTNSREIPPLGIPLSKPSQLIHQNIVVITTEVPPATARKHSREWASHYNYKPNRDESRNSKDHTDHYRYSSQFQYSSSPSYPEMSHARYNANLNQREPILSHYKPYDSHLETNYSNYDATSYNRESNRAPYRFENRMQQSSNPFNRDQLKRFQSKQLTLDSNPSKFDLLPPRYSTRLPQFRVLANNERYDVRDSGQKYFQDQKLAEASLIERSRTGYRLGYTPRYEISRLSKAENGFIDRYDRDREPMEHYKGIGVKNADGVRFHERLEGGDAWRDEKKDLKEMGKDSNDLASRQQLALNSMKTRYDESHYKNFLKTQQKVNEMLEKMLASKTSEPRSVEVI